MDLRSCTRCRQALPIAQFGTDRGKCRSKCRPCHAASEKARRDKDRNVVRQKARAYYSGNIDRIRELAKQAYWADPAKARARRKANLLANIEGARKKWRAAAAADREGAKLKAKRWYAGNQERAKTRVKHWRAANSDKCSTYSAKRRARKRGAQAEAVSPSGIYNRDHWVCGICNGDVSKDLRYPDPLSASLDHVVPLSNGGAHIAANLQCSHLVCNLGKGTGSCHTKKTNQERAKRYAG